MQAIRNPRELNALVYAFASRLIHTGGSASTSELFAEWIDAKQTESDYDATRTTMHLCGYMTTAGPVHTITAQGRAHVARIEQAMQAQKTAADSVVVIYIL
jgi:hypothetical protein